MINDAKEDVIKFAFALAKLGEKDRRAVVLRYFEGLSLRDVGGAMGVSEEAARQRVWRALEKLRANFAARGVAFPATLVATTQRDPNFTHTQDAARAAPNAQLRLLDADFAKWGLGFVDFLEAP